MALKIYNTMTRRREVFEPQQPGKVGMYACGVTVYDLSHIGHARAMVVFDVIQRYLRKLGYEVTFVRNYTDIDDKIINRANEEGVAWDVISERYIAEFDKIWQPLAFRRLSIHRAPPGISMGCWRWCKP